MKTPYYIVYEDKIRRNMEKLKRAENLAGIKLIMAFKANALWKSFPVIAEYFRSSTASSLNEMRLSADFLAGPKVGGNRDKGGEIHAYCPVYTDESFPKFLEGCSHITFNSLAQFEKFLPQIREWNSIHPQSERVSAGLRVNPQCSVIETDIYNPALPGSRFGVEADALPDIPDGLEGLHFHALCESSSFDLEKVLEAFERQFGRHLHKIKWVNMGGGHLITRADYDVEHLASVIRAFKARHPHLEIILEPGSAFTWQTGDLVTEVLDVVENNGVRTAIIDASFACHMPDCLEMPYKPVIEEALTDDAADGLAYRLGGNSCLSGDFVGNWMFHKPLEAGQRLTLLDMNHYTTVKTTMFNGIQHPSIWMKHSDGSMECLREFSYEDYRDRMD